jgi:hypothetical protein
MCEILETNYFLTCRFLQNEAQRYYKAFKSPKKQLQM